MKPVRTPNTTGNYKAPKGKEDEIADLPFYRQEGVVYSEWELDESEAHEVYYNGGRVRLGIYGEPIWPVSLEVMYGQTKKG